MSFTREVSDNGVSGKQANPHHLANLPDVADGLPNSGPAVAGNRIVPKREDQAGPIRWPSTGSVTSLPAAVNLFWSWHRFSPMALL